MTRMAITLTVNGQARSVDVEPDTPLLWAIRDTLGLTGTKFGCGIAECGACTVHVNGTRRALVHACRVSIGRKAATITTIEGLPPDGALIPCSRRGSIHQVPQCGYCQSGMIMAVARSWPQQPNPTDADIDATITNICRCGTFVRVRTRHSRRWRRAEARQWASGPGALSSAPARSSAAASCSACRRWRWRRTVTVSSRTTPPRRASSTTWISVTPDNIVTILVPHCEMGQGAQTALAMMAAEEMDADWNLVRVKEAPALDAYANAYIVRAFIGDSCRGLLERGFDYGTYRLARLVGTQATGGSMSVRGTGVTAWRSPARRRGRC